VLEELDEHEARVPDEQDEVDEETEALY